MALGSSHLAQRKADQTLPLRKLLAHPPRQQKEGNKWRNRRAANESCEAAPSVLAKLFAEGNGHDFYITRSAVTGIMLVYCGACDAYGADAPKKLRRPCIRIAPCDCKQRSYFSARGLATPSQARPESPHVRRRGKGSLPRPPLAAPQPPPAKCLGQKEAHRFKKQCGIGLEIKRTSLFDI